MIQPVKQNQIKECVEVIKESFLTVANEFGLTEENAPRFTAFATTEQRLSWHLNHENRPMYAFVENGNIVGYYSLALQENQECELNNLCVIPHYRHQGIGEKLLFHSFDVAKSLGCSKMKIGFVEENQTLKTWYAWLTEDGLFTNSGYGDGLYEVFAALDSDKRAYAFEISYIEYFDDQVQCKFIK